ncbi:MAG TPA: hypothetical protein PLJ26_06145 [Candidatus Omnitrophota bacterium]|nr:hypothetical protein [Candidatus Omnitrophota bacterium]
MKRALYILCLVSLAVGLLASIEVTTSFQHVVAAISYVSAAIFFSAAAVVRSIDRLREQLLGKR